MQGTRAYHVKLWRKGDALEYACTCPVGRDGAFCKHAVALGVAWRDAASSTTSARTKAPPRVTLDDVRAYLLKRDKHALVELLMRQASEDDNLRRQLLIQAASHVPGKLDLATWRQAIDEAVDRDGFVDYREAYAYASGMMPRSTKSRSC